MKVTIYPLTLARWADLEAVFLAPGCSVARGCWCMYYRLRGAVTPPPGVTRGEFLRRKLRARTRAGTPPGLIAYHGKTPVGWVTLGPREEFKKLEHSPVLRPVDQQAVWSIVCFVVPKAFRRQGVAVALLEGAVAYAKRRGARLVEGYPMDRHDGPRDDSMWFGTKSMFDRAGFAEVARRKPRRPIVRKVLT